MARTSRIVFALADLADELGRLIGGEDDAPGPVVVLVLEKPVFDAAVSACENHAGSKLPRDSRFKRETVKVGGVHLVCDADKSWADAA